APEVRMTSASLALPLAEMESVASTLRYGDQPQRPRTCSAACFRNRLVPSPFPQTVRMRCREGTVSALAAVSMPAAESAGAPSVPPVGAGAWVLSAGCAAP